MGGADSHGLPREVQVHAALLQQKNAVQREIERAAREEQELQSAIARAGGETTAAINDSVGGDGSGGGGGVRGYEEERGGGTGKEEAGEQSKLGGTTTEALGSGTPGKSSLQTKFSGSAAAAAMNAHNVSKRWVRIRRAVQFFFSVSGKKRSTKKKNRWASLVIVTVS